MKKHQVCNGNEGTIFHCNKCGKELLYSNGIFREGVLQVMKEWDYFSTRDLQIHQFRLCEKCYESMTEEFVIPVDIQDKKEVL